MMNYGTKSHMACKLSMHMICVDLGTLPFLITFISLMIAFTNFSIVCWNIRRAASNIAKKHIKDLVARSLPFLLCLFETHVQFDKNSQFWNSLGYSLIAISEASGHSGGIWVLGTSSSTFQLLVIDIHP